MSHACQARLINGGQRHALDLSEMLVRYLYFPLTERVDSRMAHVVPPTAHASGVLLAVLCAMRTL